MMRWLVIGVVALSVIWGGWWFAGSTGAERGAVAAIDKARASGWDIAYDELSVVGFPNRFDTTITGPVVTSPNRDWTWQAPFLQVFALAYRPNHVIVVAPPTQTIETVLGEVQIASEDLRASAVVTPGAALTLDRATVTGKAFTANVNGESVTLADGLAALQQQGGANDYALALTLTDLSVPSEWLALVPAMQGQLAQVRFVGTGRFAEPLDRHLRGEPGLDTLDITDLSLTWGAVQAQVRGSLTAGVNGRADGEITVRVQDLEAAMGVLQGVVPEDRLAFARRFLAGFATDDVPNGADVSLTVREGLVLLGPIPVFLLPPLKEPER